MGEIDRSVVFVRRINAPSSDVFKAWTDPALLCKWLAPGESFVTGATTDLRVGGAYRVEFQSPEGNTHEFKGVYRDLQPPNRITKTWLYSGPVDFLCGSESIVQVDIRELGPRLTEYTLTHRQIASKVCCDAYEADWPTCLEKLAVVLGEPKKTTALAAGGVSKFFSEDHRALQDRFDSRRMADLMENGLAHGEFSDDEKAFIESRDMFFLSTIDTFGRPTVSYKGGPVGFVRITGPSTLTFPSYDGNGMHYSTGNIAATERVGLLFINFETPNRLRVHGSATLSFDEALVSSYPGADYVVSVEADEIWLNCARYIHQYKKVSSSKYTPEAGKEQPIPAWKRIDFVQPALPEKDQGKAQTVGGEITLDQFVEKIATGQS